MMFLGKFERLIRFGFVGLGVTAFYSCLTLALLKLKILDNPTAASAVAFIATQPLAYAAHRLITYADVAADRAYWPRFLVTSVAGFVVTTVSMRIVDQSHLSVWVGLAIGWVLVPAVNYAVNAVWVFRVRDLLALRRD